MKHLHESINVLLYLSTWPFADGRYGVVRDLWICKIWHRAENKRLPKILPWSENNCNGYPSREKISFTAVFAVISAVCDATGSTSTHLVHHHEYVFISLASFWQRAQKVNMYSLHGRTCMIFRQWNPTIGDSFLVLVTSLAGCHISFDVLRHLIPPEVILHPCSCFSHSLVPG